jgi:hypothetical protein
MSFCRRLSIFFIVSAMATFWGAASTAASGAFTEGSVWELSGTSTEDRWLEIHHIEGAGDKAVYHVSVLSRLKGRPVWDLRHVVPHMAITDAALRRSVIRLAPRPRTSYPETYEAGYREWRALQAKGGAPICETSILECAHR